MPLFCTILKIRWSGLLSSLHLANTTISIFFPLPPPPPPIYLDTKLHMVAEIQWALHNPYFFLSLSLASAKTMCIRRPENISLSNVRFGRSQRPFWEGFSCDEKMCKNNLQSTHQDDISMSREREKKIKIKSVQFG